jgi:predicted dehydrogenase
MERRKFLRRVAAASTGALVVPSIIPASALGRNGAVAPSDRIEMAIVGAGSQGKGNMTRLVRNKAVQFVAVCDVDEKHQRQAKGALQKYYKSSDIRTYKDYREVLDKEKLDAALISVPDHWHAILYKSFAEAKIDMYGEKPLVRKLAEGKEVVKAVKDNGIVWQTGSWQRSDAHFQKAVGLVRSGVLGKLKHVEVGLPNFDRTVGMPAVQDVPKGVDWDMWLGPAAKKPFRGTMHWDWRWIMDYSGGQLTDWSGHHIDIALWGMDLDREGGPTEIEAKATFAKGDYWDIPHTFDIRTKLSNGIPMRIANQGQLKYGSGTTWYGENGWIHVTRGKKDGLSASSKDLLKADIADEHKLGRRRNHYDDFVECVKTRQEPIAHVKAAYKAISVGLLGEIAYLTGEKIQWDPIKEELVGGSAKATGLLANTYRKPWTL